MKITHTLIQQFLENRCTAEEAAAVARYLKKYPELTAMYLRSSWDAAGRETTMPANYADEMLGAIQAQMSRSNRVVRYRWWAAAASLVMLAAAAMWLLRPAPKGSGKALSTTDKQPAGTAWKQYANTTGAPRTIRLTDGSVVKLAPAARLRYREPFEQGQRAVYLDGEADFEVAHDTTRPFTVHSRLFATTALGTSFRVSETAAGCNIKLFTGKVLIKARDRTLQGWQQDIILLPGSQLKYSLAKGVVQVNKFNAPPRPPAHAHQEEAARREKEALEFDNTPLQQVIEALTAQYHTPIDYNEEQVSGKYFSGKVLKGDSLSLILKVIANMNELQVTKKDNGYIVSKSR